MRKTMLAGAVALALTGTGAAIAWSATGTPAPSPSPSQSAPGRDTAPGQHMKAQRPQPLHGEGVVKNPDGTFQTVLEQRGTVESVSDSAITVKSEDGFSQAYAVNGDTRITVIPKADDGTRAKPADGTIADIAAGDTVRIAGVKDGDKATAKRIVKGAGDGPGLGLGRGHGHGHGKGMGRGNNQGA
ncbi:hypothetical protein ACYSM9_00915 [Arthrobacter sp. C152]